MKQTAQERYGDIINLPHHQSESHPHMSLHDRAAQFSPFAALTGYDDAVKETARLTTGYVEMDENERERLDEKMRYIAASQEEMPQVSITYFVPDERKSGGAYETITGKIKKVDTLQGILIMTDGTVISISRISGLESELFDRFL